MQERERELDKYSGKPTTAKVGGSGAGEGGIRNAESLSPGPLSNSKDDHNIRSSPVPYSWHRGRAGSTQRGAKVGEGKEGDVWVLFGQPRG